MSTPTWLSRSNSLTSALALQPPTSRSTAGSISGSSSSKDERGRKDSLSGGSLLGAAGAGGGGGGGGRRQWIGAVEDQWVMYSDTPTDYTLHTPIGYGASSTVYLSSFHPPSSPSPPLDCAIKVINLDLLPPSLLTQLTRETRLMSLSKHPNVLRVRGSWTQGSKLYIAMRLMKKGSVADLMAYGWPGGMSEEVCRCILRQALEGLNYLHTNGFIHRDVKAANLLIDDDGTVLLGDLGVAVSVLDDVPPSLANTFVPVTAPPKGAVNGHGHGSGSGGKADAGKTLGRRRSFVGTPSWMAPEVVGRQAYDSSADIWSFGILSLEITRGRAPNSREHPSKILLHTLSRPPPTLDLSGGPHTYSQAFKDIVDSCLQKDPLKRPTAAQLLETPWFRGAKKKGYLVSSVLQGLPPLERRMERRRRESWAAVGGGAEGTGSSWDFEGSLMRTPTLAGPGTVASQLSNGSSGRQRSLPYSNVQSPGSRPPSLVRTAGSPRSPLGMRRSRSFTTLGSEGVGGGGDRASWSFTEASLSPEPELGSPGVERGDGPPTQAGEDDGEDELWESEPYPLSASPGVAGGEKTPKLLPSHNGPKLPPMEGLGISLAPPPHTRPRAEEHIERLEEGDVHTPLGGSRRPSVNGRSGSISTSTATSGAPAAPGLGTAGEAKSYASSIGEKGKGFLGSFRRRLSSSSRPGQAEKDKGIVGGLLKMGKRNAT